MKTFERASIRTHCVGTDWPYFLGDVDIGESFVIETERLNMANGPIAINGVEAGDSIAVIVEHVEILPPFGAPNGGPFFEGMGDSPSLEYAAGYFLFPKHFRLKARPSVGNIAVLPAPIGRIRELARIDPAGRGWRRVVNDPRAKHCHQDCQYLGAGSKIHLRAQVCAAGICAADVHAYIGQIEEANPIVATALDIRNCAVYGLGNYVQKNGKTEAPDQDIAIVACLPKDVFVGRDRWNREADLTTGQDAVALPPA